MGLELVGGGVGGVALWGFGSALIRRMITAGIYTLTSTLTLVFSALASALSAVVFPHAEIWTFCVSCGVCGGGGYRRYSGFRHVESSVFRSPKLAPSPRFNQLSDPS